MTISTITKLCRHCHEIKPQDSFYRKRSSKDGLNWECKDCTRCRSVAKYAESNKLRELHAISLYDVTDEEAIGEKWAVIPNTEGAYSASDHGRIRRNPGFAGSSGGILAPFREGKSRLYLAVALHCPGKRRIRRKVHQLIAETFIGERPSPKSQVNHKDGNPANNRVSNLEWCTQQQNIHHQLYVLGSIQQGEKGQSACFKDADIPALRRRLQLQSANSLAKELGCSSRTLLRIRNRETYAHIP